MDASSSSIALIVLIYVSLIFTIIELRRFIAIVNFKDEFFKTRQPILNIAYIVSFLFVLYVLHPVTLFLSNVYGIKSSIPFLVNDIADTLIFLTFFPRAWILWFDRAFVDTLKSWVWRRELNPQDTNFLIKHRIILKSPHLLVYSIYLLLIVPIFITLHILPHFNIISFYSHTVRAGLLALLLLITLYITYQISVVTDEWSIRSELMSSVKTAGTAYIIGHILFAIFYRYIDQEWALLIELLFVCIADLFVIYYSMRWTRKKFEFSQKIRLMHQLKASNGRRCSFSTFFTKRIQFQDVMDHKDGIESFCNHLTNEFGLESMLFLIEVTQFKAIIRKKLNGQVADNVPILCDRHITPHELSGIKTKKKISPKNHVFSAASILKIAWLPINPQMYSLKPYKISLVLYDKYIDESADLCINISFEIRKGIYREFAELLQFQDTDNNDVLHKMYKIYDAGFTEIWRLLQTDSFLRFKATEEFRRLVSVLFPDEAIEANKNLISEIDAEMKEWTENNKKPKRQKPKIEIPKLPQLSGLASLPKLSNLGSLPSLRSKTAGSNTKNHSIHMVLNNDFTAALTKNCDDEDEPIPSDDIIPDFVEDDESYDPAVMLKVPELQQSRSTHGCITSLPYITETNMLKLKDSKSAPNTVSPSTPATPDNNVRLSRVYSDSYSMINNN